MWWGSVRWNKFHRVASNLFTVLIKTWFMGMRLRCKTKDWIRTHVYIYCERINVTFIWQVDGSAKGFRGWVSVCHRDRYGSDSPYFGTKYATSVMVLTFIPLAIVLWVPINSKSGPIHNGRYFANDILMQKLWWFDSHLTAFSSCPMDNNPAFVCEPIIEAYKSNCGTGSWVCCISNINKLVWLLSHG